MLSVLMFAILLTIVLIVLHDETLTRVNIAIEITSSVFHKGSVRSNSADQNCCCSSGVAASPGQ